MDQLVDVRVTNIKIYGEVVVASWFSRWYSGKRASWVKVRCAGVTGCAAAPPRRTQLVNLLTTERSKYIPQCHFSQNIDSFEPINLFNNSPNYSF